MNKTALKASLQSANGYARTMTAHRMAARRGVATVKNRNGKPVMTLFYSKKDGFSYYDQSGVMCKRMVQSELRIAANN